MRTPALSTILRNVGGPIALVAWLALASPGVTAEPAVVTEIPSAGFSELASDPAATCSASQQVERAQARAVLAAQLRAAAQRQAAADGEEIVVLNGRGHNYARPQDPLAELAKIEAERLRER